MRELPAGEGGGVRAQNENLSLPNVWCCCKTASELQERSCEPLDNRYGKPLVWIARLFYEEGDRLE